MYQKGKDCIKNEEFQPAAMDGHQGRQNLEPANILIVSHYNEEQSQSQNTFKDREYA